MKEQEFYSAFERSLSGLRSGMTLKECLALYPDLQEDLRPALEAAQLAQEGVDDYVPNAALRRSRERMLVRASQINQQRPRRRSSSLLDWFSGARGPRLAFAALLVIAFFLLSWQGLLVASAQALPGDTLYPVKRGAENFSLQIASNAQLKRAREVEFERRRLDEVQELLALGRIASVEFEGVLNEMTPDRWIVDGVVVLVGADTRVTGEIEPGMVVEVSGETRPDGALQAAAIDLHSYQFIGHVDSVSEREWVISGIPVRILRSSQIDAAARLDDRVIALVEVSSDGALQAQAILRLLQPSLVATAAPQPDPTPSPTPGKEATEIAGQIESISGNVWTVSGTSFVVSGETELKGSFAVGDFVKVHLQTSSDGSYFASEIGFEDGLQPTEEIGDDDFDDEDDDIGEDDDDQDEEDDKDDDQGDDDENDGEDDNGNDNGDDDNGNGNDNDDDDEEDDDDDGDDDHGGGDDEGDKGGDDDKGDDD